MQHFNWLAIREVGDEWVRKVLLVYYSIDYKNAQYELHNGFYELIYIMLNNISVKYAECNNITYVFPNAIKPIL